MRIEEDQTDLSAALLEALRAESGRPITTGGVRRLFGTARTAAKMGASVLSGRLRRRGEDGLGAADLKAIEQLVTSLGRLKGLPMKIGQILGYVDVTLPPEMRELLTLLQTQSQPSSFEDVAATIRNELGERGQALVAGLVPMPVSAASIGQVHRGRLPDGSEVAVKVLHPGIEEAIAADFRMARIGPVFARLFAPAGGASVKSFIEEAEARLREECNYLLEAERQRIFARLFRDHETIRVPAVMDEWCSRAVLTTEWLAGRGFEDFLAGPFDQDERDRVGAALFDFFLGTLYREGLFHADPHPGNFGFCDNGTLIVYDYGCMRQFDRETVSGLAELSRAVREDDIEAMKTALARIGALPPRKERHLVRMRELLRSFFGPMLDPGERPVSAAVAVQARELMADKRALIRLRLPGKLLFLFRIRFGLYAVLARLGSICDWQALEARAVQGRGRDGG